MASHDREASQQFMAITEVDEEIALMILPKYKYNLERSLAAFFEGSWIDEDKKHDDDGGACHGEKDVAGGLASTRANLFIGNTTTNVAQLDQEGLGGEHMHASLDGLKGDCRVNIYLPYTKSDRDHGGAQNPLVCRLDTSDTLGALKLWTSKETKIPSVVLRCVFQGHSFTDSRVTLEAMGFTKRGGDVLFLYPPRDENGSVTVQDKTGMGVMELGAGEWNVSTSITELRKVIATERGLDGPEQVVLVFNGLTLANHTSFGLNGISAGSIITMLMETGRSPGNRKKGKH